MLFLQKNVFLCIRYFHECFGRRGIAIHLLDNKFKLCQFLQIRFCLNIIYASIYFIPNTNNYNKIQIVVKREGRNIKDFCGACK